MRLNHLYKLLIDPLHLLVVFTHLLKLLLLHRRGLLLFLLTSCGLVGHLGTILGIVLVAGLALASAPWGGCCAHGRLILATLRQLSENGRLL